MIRLVQNCRIAFLAGYLYLAGPRLLNAEDHLSTKWQDYSEDDGRIRVVSKYLGFEKQVSNELILKGHGVYDSISGATPTGMPAEDGINVPLSNLTDVREAGVVGNGCIVNESHIVGTRACRKQRNCRVALELNRAGCTVDVDRRRINAHRL